MEFAGPFRAVNSFRVRAGRISRDGLHDAAKQHAYSGRCCRRASGGVEVVSAADPTVPTVQYFITRTGWGVRFECGWQCSEELLRTFP
jgi:hypothetical protein